MTVEAAKQMKPSTAKEISALAQSIAPSKTMEIAALAAKLRSEGQDVIALSAGELASNTPASAKEAGIAAINSNKTRYTVNTGTVELRTAICAKYKRDMGLDYSPSQVIVSAGAKQAICQAITALAGPGDEVLVFTPYWVSYPEQIRLAGATMVEVVTTIADGFQPDMEEFAAALTDKTKVVVLNSPSNPTGAVYPKETIYKIAEICAERGIWLISDEIYEKIVFAPHKHFSPAQAEGADLSRILIVNGFSKTYAMTAWRVGYALGPESVIKACARIQSHSTSNACSIAQAAALGALQGDESGANDQFFGELIPSLLEKRDLVTERINSIAPLKTVVPEGAFYVMVDVTGLFGKSLRGRKMENATDVAKYFIEECSVAMTPGEAFGASDYLRLSYSSDKSLIEEACKRIEQGLSELS